MVGGADLLPQLAAVDARLADPLADGLGPDAQLLGDPDDGAVALALRGRLIDEPDRSLLQPGWIPS
jgi:hypothetical protein